MTKLYATALIRGMFQGHSGKPQPGKSVFPPDWLETSFLRTAVRKVTSSRALQSSSLRYGEPAGDSGEVQVKLISYHRRYEIIEFG